MSDTPKCNRLMVVKTGFEILTPDGWRSGMVPLIENAGRRCYKSEHKIEPGSAERFVERFCVDLGHTSMIEHAFATVVWTGSRAMSHQLVRHRLAAYSQESQRYCDYGKKGFQIIIPPAVPEIEAGTWEFESASKVAGLREFGRWQHTDGKGTLYGGYTSAVPEALKFQWLTDCRAAYIHYLWWRKYAAFKAEDARFHLPNGTKTEVAATYNFHTWRHIFEHRGLNPRAQWEIRGIAQEILKAFAAAWPAVFKDLVERIPECNERVAKAEGEYSRQRAVAFSKLKPEDFRHSLYSKV